MEALPKERLTGEVADLLVENHRAFLAFLERRVGDRATAEDLLQEAFVRSLEKLGQIRRTQSAVAWFYSVLRNSVIDYHRRRATSSRALSDFAAELESSSEPGSQIRGELCACVSRLAGTLKPEYAEALRRVEVEGMAVKDFASQAGISPGNAGVRVFRARNALRQRVVRSCGTCAEHGCLDCTCATPARGDGVG